MNAEQGDHFAHEYWKPIPDAEGSYEVSNLGKVRSIDRTSPEGRRLKGKELKGWFTKGGYRKVWICTNGKRLPRYVHRLVLEAFIGDCPKGMEACHNNGIANDNRLENLRWDTPSANNLDIVLHGNNYRKNLSTCPHGHKLEDPNLYPYRKKRDGSRRCYACCLAYSVVNNRPHWKPYLNTISDFYFNHLIKGTRPGRKQIVQAIEDHLFAMHGIKL